MEYLKGYDNQIKTDYITWRSLPTIFGYWTFLGTAVYLRQFQMINFDLSATIGLVTGSTVWFFSHLILGIFGRKLILTNLWTNYGCGCLAKLIAIPLLPYFGIFMFLFWAYKTDGLELINFIVGVIVGWINWFIISYFDT